MDLQDECESDCTTDHASVCDEEELTELDSLLFAAESASVERADYANDSATEDDGKLDEDERPAPPARDQRVERQAHVRVDCGLGGLTQERESQGCGLTALG